MKIGLDIMGGDFAPEAMVSGAVLAFEQLPSDVKIVLIGDKNKAEEILNKKGFDISNFEYIHTTEVIEMGEHPAKAFQQKPNSSIAAGFHLLTKGAIDGFASAGNTGAMLVGAMFTIKSVPGVIRPTITASLPQMNGKNALLLDVGLNPDSKPDVLHQYGILGSIYAENLYDIEKPRVALLNLGSEAEKGNLAARAAYEIMNGTTDFNFVGNIEGNDLFDDAADVIVCDGFVGNVVLKQAEAFYKIIRKNKIENPYFERFNYENFGGTPVLGVNGNVIIGHGISNDKAIKNMLLFTKDVINAKLPERFKKRFL
ncbi:MAG TPA: phosphate acyltransferase PlsX [Bacteroidales bacterium]|nr:phosphate acyltransferase PlsX [Bacteroidales bacterium]